MRRRPLWRTGREKGIDILEEDDDAVGARLRGEMRRRSPRSRSLAAGDRPRGRELGWLLLLVLLVLVLLSIGGLFA